MALPTEYLTTKENPQQQAHLAAGGRGTGQRKLPVQEVNYMSEVENGRTPTEYAPANRWGLRPVALPFVG